MLQRLRLHTRRYLIILGSLFILASGSYFLWADKAKSDSTLHGVGSINGEPVSLEELQFYADRHRAEVQSYYSRTYGAQASPQFWLQETNGELPAKTLLKSALDELTRVKVVLSWAKEEELLPDTSYDAFLKAWAAENQSRKKALAEGKVIYGPQQFDENSYFDYWFSSLQAELQSKLSASVFNPTDDELHQFYQNHLSSYAIEPTVQVQQLYVSNAVQQGEGTGAEVLDEAEQLLSKGVPMKEVSSKIKSGAARIRYAERSYGGRFSQDDSEGSEELGKLALQLAPGQSSGAIPLAGGWFLLSCISRTEAGFQSFEEVKDLVKSNWIQEQMQQEVSDRISRSTVDLRTDVYKKLRYS